jgi:DNA-binding transcriptional regulator LsrR (DeoR family)
MNNETQTALIAKMYYLDKIKQNEIAKFFNMSSMMVSRILKDAEAAGLVTFHVKMPWQLDMELGGRIIKKYGLQDCYALDIPEDEELPFRLGSCLADFFTQILPPKNGIVGLSWGNIIAKFVDALPYIKVQNCSIVQLTGAFASPNSKITPIEIMNIATKKLDGKLYILNAPLYASSKKMRDQMLEDPVNREIMEMAGKSDINVIGLSNLGTNASTYKTGVIDREDLRELTALHSIGDLAGTFLDDDGKPLQWSKSKLNTGVTLRHISTARHVICVAGEMRKLNILRKVCGQKYFNILFTTRSLAEALLAKE